MSDQDYIKKAVELADGWESQGEQETVAGTTAQFVRVPVGFLSVSWSSFLEHRAYLDALAAQLVRQVDATDYGITFNTDNERKTAVWGSHGFTPSVISSSFGPDRTMNTLKCIVDSGVLV